MRQTLLPKDKEDERLFALYEASSAKEHGVATRLLTPHQGLLNAAYTTLLTDLRVIRAKCNADMLAIAAHHEKMPRTLNSALNNDSTDKRLKALYLVRRLSFHTLVRKQVHIMYTIGKVSEGIILICRVCGHIEHVSQFNVNLGSQRTQAARAMQGHARDKHNAARLTSLPKHYGVMAQSQWWPSAGSFVTKRAGSMTRVTWQQDL